MRSSELPGHGRHALLVEDDGFTRSMLAGVISGAGFEVRECTTANEALEAFERFPPDVLVVDIQLKVPPNGAQLANALQARAPRMGIVVVSQYPSPASAGISSPIPVGAAFVNKGRIDSPGVLVSAIESVLGGDAIPVQRPATRAGDPLADCSAEQIAVLRMIALGYSNERIARERGTSTRAVERLVHRLYVRLGVSTDPDGYARVKASRIYTQAFGLPHDE